MLDEAYGLCLFVWSELHMIVPPCDCVRYQGNRDNGMAGMHGCTDASLLCVCTRNSLVAALSKHCLFVLK